MDTVREEKAKHTFALQSGRMRALTKLKNAHPEEYKKYLSEGIAEAEHIFDRIGELTIKSGLHLRWKRE